MAKHLADHGGGSTSHMAATSKQLAYPSPAALAHQEGGNVISRLVRLPEALKVTGLSRTSFYLGIDRGDFTPVNIGSRAIAFDERELQSWIARRIEAAHARRAGRVAVPA